MNSCLTKSRATMGLQTHGKVSTSILLRFSTSSRLSSSSVQISVAQILRLGKLQMQISWKYLKNTTLSPIAKLWILLSTTESSLRAIIPPAVLKIFTFKVFQVAKSGNTGKDRKGFRLQFDVGTNIGDNFVCELLRCTMFDEIDPTKIMHVMIKLPPENEVHRIKYRVDKFFKNEAAMYEKVLPALAECLKENGLLEVEGAFPNTARTYGVRADGKDNVTIVMEDLRHRGFIMQDRKAGLNEHHCRLVLRRLARLHAASLALQLRNPELHEKLADQLIKIIYEGEIPKSYLEAMNVCRSLIGERFPEGTIEREKFENYAKRNSEILINSVKRNSTLSCITHGDLWVNNILFKYKAESSEPDELYFVDFQVSRMASPILDLSYFFCICTRKDTRKSFDDLIKVYYATLSKTLSGLGQDPESIIPWNLFQEQLRRYFCFGWGLAVRHLPTAFLDEERLKQFQSALANTGQVKSTFILPQDTDHLKIVLGDLLEDLVSLEFM